MSIDLKILLTKALLTKDIKAETVVQENVKTHLNLFIGTFYEKVLERLFTGTTNASIINVIMLKSNYECT